MSCENDTGHLAYEGLALSAAEPEPESAASARNFDRSNALDDVKRRLKGAADTLRRLKSTGWHRPARPHSSWPDIVQNYFEAGLDPEGKPREPRVTPARPTPRAIDEMDEALEWLGWLTREQRVAVFAAAMGIRRSLVARRLHCSRVTAWRHETAGLLRIVARRSTM